MEDTNAIIRYIQHAKKSTPVCLYVQGHDLPECKNSKSFGSETMRIIFGEVDDIQQYIIAYKDRITMMHREQSCRNSAIGLLDIINLNARIEPGAYIREQVTIGDHAIIMSGAVINIGVCIGEETLIDMNVVLGGRASIGSRCHIGAGAVVAGVIEPPSAKPVIIEDDVIIGANAVILEGVHVGKHAVVGAGSIVTKDVPEGAVVVGNPARIVKETKDEKTKGKTEIVSKLRDL